MALIIVLAALAILLIVLLTPKRVRFKATLSRAGIRSLIHLPGVMKLVREETAGSLGKVFGKKKKRKKLVSITPREAFSCIKTEKTMLHIRMGIADDAAATAFLCGVLRAVLDAASQVLSQKNKLIITVKPDFERGTLWIYMEGIMRVYPGKLIRILIDKQIREGMQKWRILSRTLWKRPWRNSGKWSM